MIFPVGTQLGEVRRFPVVSLGFVLLLLVANLATYTQIRSDRDDAKLRTAAILAQVQAHPWARLPEADIPPLTLVRSAGRPARGMEPYYLDLVGEQFEVALEAEEERLGRMVEDYRAAAEQRLVVRFGFTPAEPSLHGAVTYLFVGGGLIGLALSVWMLFLFGLGVEDAFGWWAVPALFLLGGVMGAIGLMALGGDRGVPVVGSVGGVGAVAAALFVRYPGLKIRCAYWWQFEWGTTDLPALFVLLGWLLLTWLVAPSPLAATIVLGCGMAVGGLAAFALMGVVDTEDVDPVVSQADVNEEGADAYRRGVLHLERNNPGLAVQALQRAKELDPTSVSVDQALWRAIRAQGIPDRVVAWAEPRIMRSIKGGGIRLALQRWREMTAVLGNDGPTHIRQALADSCGEFEPETARRLKTALAREAAVDAALPTDDAPAAWLGGDEPYIDLAPVDDTVPDAPSGKRLLSAPALITEDAPEAPGDDLLAEDDAAPADDPTVDPKVPAAAAGPSPHQTQLGWRPSGERAPSTPAPRPKASEGRRAQPFRKLEVTRAKLVAIDGNVLQFHTGAELTAERVGSVAFGRVKTRSGHILIIDLLINWRQRNELDELQVLRLENRSTDAREVLSAPDADAEETFERLARTIATLGYARMLPDAWAVPGTEAQEFATLAHFEATYARRDA